MRLINWLVAVVLSTFCVLSVWGNSNQPGQRVISGRIVSYDPTSNAQIQVIYNLFPVDDKEIVFTPDSLGYFKVNIDADAASDMWFFVGNRNFLFQANPGDSVHLEIDLARQKKLSEAVIFSGDHAKNNHGLLLYREFRSQTIECGANRNDEAIKELGPVAYKAFQEAEFASAKESLHQFIVRHDFNSALQQWMWLDIEANYLHHLYWYPKEHMRVNNISIFEENDWKLPEDYFHFMERYSTIDQTIFLNKSFAKSVLDAYPNLIYAKMKPDRKPEDPWNVIKGTGGIVSGGNTDSLLMHNYVKHCSNPILLELLLVDHIVVMGQLRKERVNTYENYTDMIDTYITSGFIRRPLDVLYTEVSDRLARVRTTSFENVYDLGELKSGREILDHIQQQHVGKYVYLDVWATWCGPCLQQMPNSVKLHHELAGKPVEFVYLCIESDRELALASIDKYALAGSHYILNKEQSASLKEYLQITGIPFYLLTNPLKETVVQGNGYGPLKITTLFTDLF